MKLRARARQCQWGLRRAPLVLHRMRMHTRAVHRGRTRACATHRYAPAPHTARSMRINKHWHRAPGTASTSAEMPIYKRWAQ